uniref:Uncharacterized protein n=1 Tax=viral metagenome TaxID=1070528 RepID=A0A6C0D884_9ZZZZ
MYFIKYIIYMENQQKNIVEQKQKIEEKIQIEWNKTAVVVLTRGYNNLQQYNTLIQRNISIVKKMGNMFNKIDILIFHEGNILVSHQQFISKFTPLLNIKFIYIKEHAFKDDKKTISFFEPTKSFGLNYRHMCSFWFVDFWNYVKEYDMILRIDEDCIIDFNIPELFFVLQNKSVVYGEWTRDKDFVTYGLNNYTKKFIGEHIHKNANKPIFNHIPSGPYTNVFGLNLKILRENRLIQNYIQKIKDSNFIYIFRWGDLPLWGEALFYFCDPEQYYRFEKIKYFHGSHNYYVGSKNKNMRNRISNRFQLSF